MAPKSDPSAPKASARRPTNQPKSSRQQFSACGACRIRRVRCDLKDLPAESKTCSNCQEHGFNCVDEYRDMKSVKLLRRGRRIQQVEAVYGPGAPSEHEQRPDHLSHSPSASPGSQGQSVIPRLDPRFFDSRFYARFHIQRTSLHVHRAPQLANHMLSIGPIIEPEEFKARYIAFFNGSLEALGIAGQLIAMLLVVWAASYGVDEFGREEPHDGAQGVQRRKERTNAMVNELLHLIDIHGLPRKPSWDGVRVLLLIMPLTEEVAQPLERLTMYETAINQVYTLCSLASPRSVNSGQGETVDALVRARIYWYAFVHEGITTGLRGGRLHLADDDLEIFQTMQEVNELSVTRSEIKLSYSRRWALAPLRLATACRQVHSALTGAKACARQEVDERKLHLAWESIEKCWEEFESLRQLGLLGILTVEEADRFVDGWKIFIFECHNVIREFLKQRLVSASGAGDGAYVVDVNSLQQSINSLAHLHAIAESKCHDVAQHVVSLVRRHLGTSFFEYDASLVRDGCFFAGYILAGEGDTEEQGNTCLQALSEMRWAFSKSEERAQTLKLIWEARMSATRTPSQDDRTPPPFNPPPSSSHEPAMPRHYSTSGMENHDWLTSTPSETLSLNNPSTSHQFPTERHTKTYRSSSMSSRSSAPSTNSPYTPTIQAVPPASHTRPLGFIPKVEHVPHADMLIGEGSHKPSLTPTIAPSSDSTGTYYQYVEQTQYSHPHLPEPHQQQYAPMPFSQHGFVGPHGLLYTSQPRAADGSPLPVQGDSHPYSGLPPDVDAPYFYSS